MHNAAAAAAYFNGQFIFIFIYIRHTGVDTTNAYNA